MKKNRAYRAVDVKRIKPELVVVFDRLAAPEPKTYEYWLHATEPLKIDGQRDVKLKVGGAACDIELLAPEGLTLTQTNQYDPNPRPRVTLREWHLTATTSRPQKEVQFVTVLRPRRDGEAPAASADLKTVEGGYVLSAELTGGRVVAPLPTAAGATVRAGELTARGNVLVRRFDANGKPTSTLEVTPLKP